MNPLPTPDAPRSVRTRTRLRASLVAMFAALVLLGAACGSEPVPISAPSAGESAAQAAAADGDTAPVQVASSEFGDILVNPAGFSLYGFTEDVDGVPTCEGGCLGAWPALLTSGPDLPAGLDASVFSVVERSDGSHQLKAGKWPLYLFAGDSAAGQTTGHLSGDVWFLAAPDGSLIGVDAPAEAAAPVETAAAEAPAEQQAAAQPALVSTGSTDLGDVLVNADGLTLYGFTNDVDGAPTCEGGCAEAWPPILVSDPAQIADLDPAIFSVVDRPDGTSQLKAGKWPLYLFAGDTSPGQTTGHLSGDVWFAAAPDGSLIDAAAEAAAEEAAAPEEQAAPAQAAPGPFVSTGTSDVGDILVDSEGFSLYGFANDFQLEGSVCVDGCAQAWPPVLVESADLPSGLDPAQFSVIAREDGTWQLKSGIWPLYRFGGDTAPGQTTGHLSGDVWFLASPDGKLIGFVPPAPAEPAPTAAPVQQAPAQPAPTAAPAQPAPTATPAPAYGDTGNSGYGDNSGYGNDTGYGDNSGYGSDGY